jgi:sugar lactone lactonase YvrE
MDNGCAESGQFGSSLLSGENPMCLKPTVVLSYSVQTLSRIVGCLLRMTQGSATPIAFMTLVSLPHHAAGEQTMFWSDRVDNTVRQSYLDGTNIVTLQAGLGQARGIDVDLRNGYLYWADNGINQKKIQRSRLDGTQVEDLVTGLNFPAGVALDVSGGKLYWADTSNHKIQRSNLDGTNVEDLVTGLGSPYFVATDPIHGHVYWTDFGTDKIQRANFDGTNVVDLVTSGLNTTRGIALDLANDMMYWADRGTDLIQRANLDGTNIETLVTIDVPGVDPAPHGVALDLARGHLYWVDNGTVKIQRSNLDGSNVQEILTGASGFLSKPWQIVLDLEPEPCDFDRSGACDAHDIDLISAEVRAQTNRPYFNLNPTVDSVVDHQDRKIWIEDLADLTPGDANFDGLVNAADFELWSANRFQPDTGWASGDFDGNGATDVADFNIWNDHRDRAAMGQSAVPEMGTIYLLAWAAVLTVMTRRR